MVAFTHDWADSYLQTDETLLQSTWSVDPAGLSIDASSHTAARASVTLSGGTAGAIYRVSNRVTTSDNRVEERAIAIRVQQR